MVTPPSPQEGPGPPHFLNFSFFRVFVFLPRSLQYSWHLNHLPLLFTYPKCFCKGLKNKQTKSLKDKFSRDEQDKMPALSKQTRPPASWWIFCLLLPDLAPIQLSPRSGTRGRGRRRKVIPGLVSLLVPSCCGDFSLARQGQLTGEVLCPPQPGHQLLEKKSKVQISARSSAQEQVGK